MSEYCNNCNGTGYVRDGYDDEKPCPWCNDPLEVEEMTLIDEEAERNPRPVSAQLEPVPLGLLTEEQKLRRALRDMDVLRQNAVDAQEAYRKERERLIEDANNMAQILHHAQVLGLFRGSVAISKLVRDALDKHQRVMWEE